MVLGAGAALCTPAGFSGIPLADPLQQQWGLGNTDFCSSRLRLLVSNSAPVTVCMLEGAYCCEETPSPGRAEGQLVTPNAGGTRTPRGTVRWHRLRGWGRSSPWVASHGMAAGTSRGVTVRATGGQRGEHNSKRSSSPRSKR